MKLSSFLIPGILIMTALYSCSKSSGGKKPKLSIESINNPVQFQQDLDVTLKFSNGSKLAGGMLVVFRSRVNEIPPVNTEISGDSVYAVLPDFGGVDKGQLEFTQPYTYLHFDDHINDTLIFKFAVIDADGNSSDTISSSKVVSISP